MCPENILTSREEGHCLAKMLHLSQTSTQCINRLHTYSVLYIYMQLVAGKWRAKSSVSASLHLPDTALTESGEIRNILKGTYCL